MLGLRIVDECGIHTRPPTWWAAIVLAVAVLGLGVEAEAQTRHHSASIAAGSGVTLGTSQSGTAITHSPLFLDIAYRTWSSEEPWLVVGASGRVEVDGRTSVGVVPRVELSYDAGPMLLRPGLGAPLFIAPFTMFGVEGSLTGQLTITESVAALATIAVDAFLFGSDVPSDSVVLMFNGAVGVALTF